MSAQIVSSTPGAAVPLEDVTQIAALSQSEAAINLENVQRNTTRTILEYNRKVGDKQTELIEKGKEYTRRRATESNNKDTHVAPVQKPSYWDATKAKHEPPAKVEEATKAVAKVEQASVAEKAEPVPSNSLSPPVKEVVNEEGTVVKSENIPKSKELIRAEARLEKRRQANELRRQKLGCGTHWYCTGCDWLDKDWMDFDPEATREKELGLKRKLKKAKDPGEFSGYMACLKQMKTSKIGGMVKSMSKVMDKGLPAMANAAINNVPIANKEKVFKKDIFKCAQKMGKDGASVKSFNSLLKKTGMSSHALTNTNMPKLGTDSISIKKMSKLAKGGSKLLDSFGKKDKRLQVDSIIKNPTLAKTVNPPLQKSLPDNRSQVGPVTNNPEYTQPLGV